MISLSERMLLFWAVELLRPCHSKLARMNNSLDGAAKILLPTAEMIHSVAIFVKSVVAWMLIIIGSSA